MRKHPTLWSYYKISEIKDYQIAEAGAIQAGRPQTAIDCGILLQPVHAGIRPSVLYGIPRAGESMKPAPMPKHISVYMLEVLRQLIQRAQQRGAA